MEIKREEERVGQQASKQLRPVANGTPIGTAAGALHAALIM
jgi:hypothetical protein